MGGRGRPQYGEGREGLWGGGPSLRVGEAVEAGDALPAGLQSVLHPHRGGGTTPTRGQHDGLTRGMRIESHAGVDAPETWGGPDHTIAQRPGRGGVSFRVQNTSFQNR